MLFKPTALLALFAAGIHAESACQKQPAAWNQCAHWNKPETYGQLKSCLCWQDEGLFHQAWKCAVEKDSSCQYDNYWRLRFIDFKFYYCQDPNQKYNGDYEKAWRDHDNIWAERYNLMKI
ncbi:hypothetical protein CDD80_4510 [Ophiocordyceps camponoti-rufipedis]|uniref:Extracellular membrane protein CFEM domain-containing protein n=1 Tax=Ophiocordyceps camponoti-rufipedis TaxID=2004952 RepID=A0A2C5Y2Z0_9HYPO|nr:hypothetical protein CDD80_4510 [Ophiocordyceps camponoti-rufipedis]